MAIQIGQMVNVVVGKDGKVASKVLKVVKANSKTTMFMEVDKKNRKNIFRKITNQDIAYTGIVDSIHVNPHLTSIFLKEGVLPIKWESAWDTIGQISNMNLNARITPHYNNHSKGWSQKAAWYKANSQFASH
jgi:hypothetical protein